MPVHGVLVQAQEQVELVPVAVYLIRAESDEEKYVTTADDGLVGVVGVQVEARRTMMRARISPGVAMPCPASPPMARAKSRLPGPIRPPRECIKDYRGRPPPDTR